jgi:hypothetical protein
MVASAPEAAAADSRRIRKPASRSFAVGAAHLEEAWALRGSAERRTVSATPRRGSEVVASGAFGPRRYIVGILY